MDHKPLVDTLYDLATNAPDRPESARLRDVFDAVEAAIAAGVRRTAILAALHSQGFTMQLKTFDNAMYRIRKRKRTCPGETTLTRKRANQSGAESTPRSTPDVRRIESSNPDDLTRIMAARVDLDALSKLSKRNQ